jgi:hypothetical protein
LSVVYRQLSAVSCLLHDGSDRASITEGALIFKPRMTDDKLAATDNGLLARAGIFAALPPDNTFSRSLMNDGRRTTDQ